MKKLKLLIIGLFAVVGMLIASNSFAALAVVSETWTSDDVREVNNATPGTSKTFLGTRLRGVLFTGSTTYASGDNGNPSTYATPTTTVFLKTTGAAIGESYLLGNGTYNQRLTAVLVTDGGKDFYITPLTKSGFTNAQLNDAKDTVTLKYINDTVGWVIEGNNGATIN